MCVCVCVCVCVCPSRNNTTLTWLFTGLTRHIPLALLLSTTPAKMHQFWWVVLTLHTFSHRFTHFFYIHCHDLFFTQFSHTHPLTRHHELHTKMHTHLRDLFLHTFHTEFTQKFSHPHTRHRFPLHFSLRYVLTLRRGTMFATNPLPKLLTLYMIVFSYISILLFSSDLIYLSSHAISV